MKSSIIVLLFSLVLIVGCSTSRPKIRTPKTYMCTSSNKSEYITLTFPDRFYYIRPDINRSILGLWDIKNDTMVLVPKLMYFFENDSLVKSNQEELLKLTDIKNIPYQYWATKFLIKDRHVKYLIDITDYAEMLPDSLLKPELTNRKFIGSK